jgi:hypothetical protein
MCLSAHRIPLAFLMYVCCNVCSKYCYNVLYVLVRGVMDVLVSVVIQYMF